MKASIALSSVVVLAAKTLAVSCWSEKLGYPCCSSKNASVHYLDAYGKWSIENGDWCGIPDSTECWSEKLGYPCCSSKNASIHYLDAYGKWSIENGDWCGIPDSTECWARKFNFPCCSSTNNNVIFSDSDGKWGIEYGEWCGINYKPCCEPPSINKPYTITGNPFKGHRFFINPYYVAEVDMAIGQISDASLIQKAEKMKEYSNAIWLDSIESMNAWLERNLKAALIEEDTLEEYVLTVFVVYDLPGRDCHALASNGELLANNDDFERYKTEYIDVIAEKLAYYNSQPVVLVIEPGSLVNMVTNIESIPACVKSEKYYLDGHAYLIKKFGQFSHVAMYLDIGHAFWLGWDDTREKAAMIYSMVIELGSPGKVRGFASNVANYTPWEDPELSLGPDTEWNSCPDEKRYIEAMYKDFKAAGIESVYFIEDTSRNGVKNDRYHPGEWCNQMGSGIGARPQANPISDMDYLDAFYWVKPYGESDGTSDESSEHYDGNCGQINAMKPAPEAGQWFQAFFEEGLKNANPPL